MALKIFPDQEKKFQKQIDKTMAHIKLLTKRYDEAKDYIFKYSKQEKRHTEARIIYSHIMAALDEKKKSLAVLTKEDFYISGLDCLEVYIINFELDRALHYIKENIKPLSERQKIIIAFLKLSIFILKNREISHQIRKFNDMIKKKKSYLKNLDWSFDELKLFLSYSLKKKRITKKQKNTIENIIKKLTSK